MNLSSDKVQLCLSLAAYVGLTGEASRDVSALRLGIQAALEQLGPTRGHEIVWGPASFRPWWQPSAGAIVIVLTRPPGAESYTLVVRAGGPMSLWDSRIESLGCLDQEPWMWVRGAGNLAPAVCTGLLQLLATVLEMTPEEHQPGAGRSLAEFLATQVASAKGERKLPVHVCGHGLGGSLASAVALWLRDTQGQVSARDLAWDPDLGAKVHCTAFASLCVGNPDFVRYIGDRLGGALELIHNTLDPIPTLWDTQSMATLAGLYQPHVEEPRMVRALVGALCQEIDRCGVEYEQPEPRLLDGRIELALPRSYVAQAEYQHLHAYAALLGIDADLDAILDHPAGIDGGPVAQ